MNLPLVPLSLPVSLPLSLPVSLVLGLGTVSLAPAAQATPAHAAPAVSVDDFLARTYDDGKGHVLPYRLFVPRGIDPKKNYPLVMFLHGSGGRGTDNKKQLTDQAAPLVFAEPANQAKWPVFMLAPQCPPDQKWVDMPWDPKTGKGKQPAQPTWPMAAAIAVVDQLVREFPGIDASRLFVTGMSMGGYGTWDAAVRNPKKWKAAVVVCGGYDETKVAPIVGLPVWVFHAEDDPTVPVVRSRDMIAALRALHGTPKYTEYPASAHHGHFSWKPAYSDPELLPWMFGPPPGSPPSRGTDAPPSARP